MNERIALLRETLGYSQDKFGEILGVTRSSVCSWENGRRNISDSIIKSICREFRVNYFWLTEGEGDMFTGTPESVVDEIAEDYNLDSIDKKLIEKYLELTPGQRAVIKNYLKSIFAE